MTTSDSWTTIESDPGVFTELIEKMGAQGVQCEELWSCDPASLQALRPIYGLIFLFRWQKEPDDRPVDMEAAAKGVFFASQVINNACATQAIINLLMNIPSNTHGFQLGQELTQLREFTSDFPPEMKGLAIGNSDVIRNMHNSFRAPQPLLPDEDKDDTTGEAFHFVTYVPAAGGLYELDGLKPGPIRHCDCTTEEDWLYRAAEAVNQRIAKYAASEVRFNLMALVRARPDVYEEQLKEARKVVENFRQAPKGKEGGDVSQSSGGGDINAAQARLSELEEMLVIEKEKRRRWSEENVRRRTDFTPLIFNLLKSLAAAGQLEGLVKKAEEETARKKAAQQQR